MFENTIVTSKAFGNGVIISLEDTSEIYSLMSVDFNGTIKKFAYPLCFEKYLTTENEELTKKALKELKVYTQLEADKKRARIKAILSERGLI